jgi:hypothetical protein
MPRRLLLLLMLFPAVVHAATVETQWYAVLLDGRKIGQFESTREVRDTRVITRQSMLIEIERAGTRMALGSNETSEETLDGKPLAFDNSSRMSDSETRVVGLVDGRRATVRYNNAGAWSERTIDWPRGALLPEGLRLAMLDMPLEAGATLRASSFQPASFDAIEDPQEQRYFMNLPTSFVLSAEEVDRLRALGGRLLRESPSYRELIERISDPHASAKGAAQSQ